MINKSLLSGTTAMLILKLLSKEDMYGYEMIDTLRQMSNNVFELKAGTLYPLLRSLEQDGAVESYSKDIGKKTRNYYHLTEYGKKLLQEKESEWKLYSSSVLSLLESVLLGGDPDEQRV